jgi:uncharacterized protein (TIGR02145 family)
MKTLKIFTLLVCISVSVLDAQTIMNIHQSNGTVLQIPLNTIDSITYTSNNPINLATLSTTPMSVITGLGSMSGGNISDDGGSPITQRGVCWNTAPNPTTSDNFTNNGTGTGLFISNINGLETNTTYYLRAYAINGVGTAYGNQLTFTTDSDIISSLPGQGVTFNGYTYNTIILGNEQEWMAENLLTAFYSNGDPISNISDFMEWDSITFGAWCHYDNNNQLENPYGKWYNGYAIADSRNICPLGWHVPDEADWNALIGYIDPEFTPSPGVEFGIGGTTSQTAAGKLKSVGTQYWLPPNQYMANNLIGFNGLPAGNSRGGTNNSLGMGTGTSWWSSSPNLDNQGYGWSMSINHQYNNVELVPTFSNSGYSVRCVKD